MFLISYTLQQSFFPKNRNRWKRHSSWKPEEPSERRGRGAASDGDDDDYNGIGGGGKRPPEVQVKRGYSWSQQMGIAIACLVDKGEVGLINWVKEVCSFSFLPIVSCCEVLSMSLVLGIVSLDCYVRTTL